VPLNRLFHDGKQLYEGKDGPVLPPHLIMFNHGHDGNGDGWETRVTEASGEYPIVYFCLDAPTTEPEEIKFQSFRAYAKHFALHYAP
jgi:hypothetical protein